MTNRSEGLFPFRKSITKEEIADLNPYSYEGDIRLIDTTKKLKEFEGLFSGSTVIGFDTETKPTFTKGSQNSCSLVQLAFESEVVLFRLNRIGFPGLLKDILAQRELLKIGIAIHDDVKHLQQIETFDPARFVDLNKVCPVIGFESIGARRLTALVLGKRISKRQQVSNWEARELTEAQLRYAATDAWICREIFLTLQQHGLVSPEKI